MDKNDSNSLPLGKLPPAALARLIGLFSQSDPSVVLGPGLGLDCAVIDLETHYLAVKTDPITFTTDAIGWYAVQVNANDIATTGAVPRWFSATILLPEKQTTEALMLSIGRDIQTACEAIGVVVIGGHTEITYGLERPIVVGTMIGEVGREELVTPLGVRADDRLLMTGTVPIEGTAILAGSFAEQLAGELPPEKIREAQNALYRPGISVLPAARLACRSSQVTGMHDPTEGGLACALWEFAEACGHSLMFFPEMVPVHPLGANICRVFGLDPLATIASGALLLTTPARDVEQVVRALTGEGIPCTEIGWVEAGPPGVWVDSPTGRQILPRPIRDEIARLFESS